MPSQRKRIGFLPSAEVHNIIEELCIKHKFSQSKITGILVEEALFNRGILKTKFKNRTRETYNTKENIDTHNDSYIDSDISNNHSNFFRGESNLKRDLDMINEFIEYKIFKKAMKQNEKLIN